MKKIILLIPLLILISCKKGKKNPAACNGNTRREVKICTDSQASEINLTPILIGVEEIGRISAPKVSKDDGRLNIEKQVYTITAKVHKLSKHRDGDWKIKLIENNKYINCESPNMGCEYIKTSLFYSELNTARAWIEKNKDNIEGKTVTITGVAFIDIDHKYPRDAADNEIELHPILDIHF